MQSQVTQTGQGGIIEKEAPLNISNVMIVCNKCTEPTGSESACSKMVLRFVFVKNAANRLMINEVDENVLMANSLL